MDTSSTQTTPISIANLTTYVQCALVTLIELEQLMYRLQVSQPNYY